MNVTSLVLCLVCQTPPAVDAVRPLKWVTPDRIAQLPAEEQAGWITYLDRSMAMARRERELLAGERAAVPEAARRPAPSNSREFEGYGDATPEWLGSAAARTLADVVLSYQTPTGGWSKAVDYAQGTRPPGTHWTTQSGAGWHYCGTLDNRSTTEQILFLAALHSATGAEDCRTGAERGIDWLLQAQYPNGGWPQVYPLEPGYHEAITLNDNAVLHALELLLAVAEGRAPFEFMEPARQAAGRAALDRGLACMLACQVRRDGTPTLWCAQHDPITLAPLAARLKEPASLSGSESADLLKFLMREAPVTPACSAAIEAGVRWLREHPVTGLRKTKNASGKTDYVSDPASTEIYWARFYDIATGVPLFAGAEDGVIYATYSEMAVRNRVAYDYFTTRPAEIIGKEYDRWQKRLKK